MSDDMKTVISDDDLDNAAGGAKWDPPKDAFATSFESVTLNKNDLVAYREEFGVELGKDELVSKFTYKPGS